MEGYMTPHALTREQVVRNLATLLALGNVISSNVQVKQYLDPITETDAALRQALAQQAQEIKRLRESLKALVKQSDANYELYEATRNENVDLKQQLAAMTAERDEAIDETASLRASCHAFDLQVQELQVRVRELEAVLREGSDGDAYMDVHDNLMGHYILVDELKTTLAEREEQLRLANIDQANTEAALNDARQDAARLREALTAIKLCSVNSASSKAECGRIAERALKGA